MSRDGQGSWCTSFPVLPEEEWTPTQFNEFVDYFKTIRDNTFGGVLDGIDWCVMHSFVCFTLSPSLCRPDSHTPGIGRASASRSV